ncbi:MAG: MCP four helix bundle domain-containing protein, partial [Vicinamibacteria bacterium]
MRHWSISRKLYGGVGSLAVLLLAAIALGYYELSNVNDKLDGIATRDVRKVELALRIDESTTSLRSDERRLLLAGYADDLTVAATAKQDLASELESIDGFVAELEPLLVTPEGKKLLADLSATVDAWAAVNGRVQTLVLEGRAEEAWTLARTEGNPLIDRTETQVTELVATVNGLVAAAQADANAAEAQTIWIFAGLILLATGFVALVTWTVRGIVVSLLRTSDTLHDGAQQVTSAATQVSGAAQSLSQAATEQAASLEETSASMEEMASMTRQNAE